MKKFKIKVNEEIFEVEVEEIGGSPAAAAPAAPPAAPAAAPPPAPAPAAAPAAAPKAAAAPAAAPKPAAGGGGGGALCAPMPGTILEVKVKVGDAVNIGDVLLILEAMRWKTNFKRQGRHSKRS
jgi:glutaconyl-CoA decarboxylase